MGLSGSNIVDLIAQQAAEAAQPLLPAEPREEHLARAGRPVLRPRRRYTVPYVVWMDGIGWRNDKVKEDIAGMDVPWDIFWQAQAYRGRVGHPRRPARRAQHADAARRDAHRRAAGPQHGGPAVIDKAQRELSKLGAICNPKVTITDYQTLPEGKTVLHHSWSGDLLGGAFYYMPKGVPPTVLSFWGPDQNGVVQNDFFCIGRSGEEPGARARVHQLHARREERVRELRQLQRLHAAAEEHRRRHAAQARR